MPQMMPMNWTFMFAMLNTIMSTFIITLFNNSATKYLISKLKLLDKTNMWTW